ncbi:MAG: DUF4349 domain-containing protein [Planctomycetaceae bacterium]|nr:DUF4349 domain-containing protein [Planctomycetaceae bacterium]
MHKTFIVSLVLAAAMVCGGCENYSKDAQVKALYRDKHMLTQQKDEMARQLSESQALGAAALQRSEAARPAAAATLVPSAAAAARPAAVDPRRIIYSAQFAIVAPDVAAALNKAKAMAAASGGYMQQMTSDTIVMRIPAERFDPFIAELAALGTVTRKNIEAADVTEQYADLELRLRSAKAMHDKLMSLLDKAAGVKDTLAVETEIGRVREEVERLEGLLNRLRNQVSYSTISVSFTAAALAPQELKIILPFPWLQTLGLDRLLGT